jgi:hypothetical protein
VASVFALGLVFASLAALSPLGVPFFGLVPFFEEVASGATVVPCPATGGGGFGGTGFCIRHGRFL